MAALVLLGMAEEVPETLSVAVAVAESEPEALLVAVAELEPEALLVAVAVAESEPETLLVAVAVAESEPLDEALLVAVAEFEPLDEALLVAVSEPEAAADVAVEATDEETQVETAGAWVERPHPRRAVNKTPEIRLLTTGKRAPQSKQPEIESVRSASKVQRFRGLLVTLVIMLLQRDRH